MDNPQLYAYILRGNREIYDRDHADGSLTGPAKAKLNGAMLGGFKSSDYLGSNSALSAKFNIVTDQLGTFLKNGRAGFAIQIYAPYEGMPNLSVSQTISFSALTIPARIQWGNLINGNGLTDPVVVNKAYQEAGIWLGGLSSFSWFPKFAPRAARQSEIDDLGGCA